MSFLILVIALFFPVTSWAATLYTSPSTQTYESGDTIRVSVYVASSDQKINAVSGTLSFSPNTLQVTSISKSNSIVDLWVVEPTFSNSAGTVTFEGIALDPPYQGAAGTVLQITFKARAEGVGSVKFSNASVLANDGLGTDVVSSTSGSTFTISEAVVQPVVDTETQESEVVEEEAEDIPDEEVVPEQMRAPATNVEYAEYTSALRTQVKVTEWVETTILPLLFFVIFVLIIHIIYIHLKKRPLRYLHTILDAHDKKALMKVYKDLRAIEDALIDLEDLQTARKISRKEKKLMSDIEKQVKRSRRSVAYRIRKFNTIKDREHES